MGPALLASPEQLDLQLELIRLAYSFPLFGLGPQQAVRGLCKADLFALQAEADVIPWPTAWSGLSACEHEVAEKPL